jgi:hypothetical protein
MQAELTRILHTWSFWLRLRRAVRWALRGLAAGLGSGLVLGLVLLTQTGLLRSEFLALAAWTSLGAGALSALLAASWPVRHLETARTCDLACGLDERVSTAFEFSREDRYAEAEITRLQLADALASARGAQVNRALPLRLGIVDGLLVLVFALLYGLVLFWGEAWFQAAQQERAIREAVEVQAAAIEELLAEVQQDPALDPQGMRALAQPLEQALQELNDNPSLEGSVSTLVSSGEALQELVDPEAQAAARSLREAGERLGDQPEGPLSSIGEALASGETLSAATQLAQIDPAQFSPAEAEQAADQLSQLASSLAATHPELASQLNQAAQALRSGDSAAAQQALAEASAAMANAGAQAHFSQTAGQLAEQVQSGAGQLLAAGGGDQASSPGAGVTSGQEGDGGAGSGTGDPTGSSQAGGGEAGNQPIPQPDQPGDGGESAFESIYAPELLGGGGGPPVLLPGTGEEGVLIGESPGLPDESGSSLVPYQQAYPYYEEFNRQAIEQGEIPVQYIPIIRAYFDSLEP